jgi:hypothetical protein
LTGHRPHDPIVSFRIHASRNGPAKEGDQFVARNGAGAMSLA